MIDAALRAEEAQLCLPPRPMTRAPRVPLPQAAVDTHFHVFRDGAPLASPRSYTPRIQTLTDWQIYARQAGIARGVVVQPSVYGFDNGVLLEALQAAPDRLRGIAVLDPDTPADALRRLDKLGVRGVRCNTRNRGGLGFDLAISLAARIAPLNWTLQFQVRPEQLDTLAELIPTLGVRVVVDHLGFIDLDPPEVAVRRLRALLDTRSCYIKLSAPYRLSRDASEGDFAAVASALIQSHPERLLWGSDWPHTELWDNVPDDAELIERSMALFGSDAVRQTVVVDTPHALFFAH